jgi:hypothetical protein
MGVLWVNLRFLADQNVKDAFTGVDATAGTNVHTTSGEKNN